MSDEFRVLDELERRLIAGCYHDGQPAQHAVRRPRVRRRYSWAAVSAAGIAVPGMLAAIVVIASGGVTPSAARALADAARASRASATPILASGEYWYTRTIFSTITPFPLPPRVIRPGTNPAPTLIAVNLRQSVETWIGRDGTIRQRQTTLSERFADAAARRRWLASGEPLPHFGSSDSVSSGDGWFPPQYGGGGGDVGDGLFSYRQLLTLPASTRALRSRIERAQAAYTHRQQHGLPVKVQPGTAVGGIQLIGRPSLRYARSFEDLNTITMLLSTPLPAEVRAAIYRVAATLPGVRYDGHAKDALGRAGIAVAIGTRAHGMQMIFNPTTGALLQTSMLVSGSIRGVKLGPLTQTIAAQGIVRSLNSLPRGVRPIGRLLPSPLTVAISPRAGTPTSTFYLTMQGAHTSLRPVPFPPIAEVNGPTAPGCDAYLIPPPIVNLTHAVTIHSLGHVSYRYKLQPSAIDRTAWCPGRYQLQIVGNNPTSIYFQVR